MFNKAFRSDNPFWQSMGTVYDLFIVNSLWLLCSLPVFTIGPATAAAFYALAERLLGESGGISRDFFSSFRRNFKQGVLLGLPLTALGIFLAADIPERYGYKLISEEKRTRQRDVILRICYAAHFTLEETQQALRIYGMPELYAKNSRDAVLMIAFHERPGDIIEVNALLKQNAMEPLRSSGVQEWRRGRGIGRKKFIEI